MNKYLIIILALTLTGCACKHCCETIYLPDPYQEVERKADERRVREAQMKLIEKDLEDKVQRIQIIGQE